jgi:hypothetical protein
MRAGAQVPVKIATWNLARVLPTNTQRCAEIVRWLDAVDADVWVLTETHDSVSPGPRAPAGVANGSPAYPHGHP